MRNAHHSGRILPHKTTRGHEEDPPSQTSDLLLAPSLFFKFVGKASDDSQIVSGVCQGRYQLVNLA